MFYKLTRYSKIGFRTAVRQLSNRKRIVIGSIIVVCGLSIFRFVNDNLYHVKYTSPLKNVQEKVQEMKNKVKLGIQIVNPLSKDIRILKTCSYKCNFTLNSHRTLLVVVKSHIGHFDQRLAIRRTWGNDSRGKFKIAFLIGEQSYVQTLLEFEESLYHDIVQGSFEDRYENIVLKTMMGYTWIVDFCSNVHYVLFIDDDCLVNIEKLLDVIDTEDSFKNKIQMYGHIFSFSMPFRDQASKWYVSYNEYSGIFYPPYLSGAAILTDINVIEEFSIAFPYVKHFHIEDVYLGIIAKLLNIPLNHDGRFSIDYVSPGQMKDYFTSHGYGERGSLIINGWRKLNYFIKE